MPQPDEFLAELRDHAAARGVRDQELELLSHLDDVLDAIDNANTALRDTVRTATERLTQLHRSADDLRRRLGIDALVVSTLPEPPDLRVVQPE